MKFTDERLVNKGIECIQTIVNETSCSFEQAYDIQLPDFKNLDKIHKESSWFKNILSNLKSRLDTCKSFNDKVSLLTLLPDDWTFKTAEEYLQCSYHAFIEARKLREKHGILGRRVKKSYLRISLEIRNEIVDYYLNDSNTIMCSGSKECVTIKVPGQPSEIAQKKILIYDLRDLYNNWKEDSNREVVPCLAFFTSLKPKQCVFAGDPGTHNICVCPIHENIRLKLAAVQPTLNYIKVIEAGVCSLNSKLCMFNECDDCPQESGIEEFLRANIPVENIENVKYSNWASATVDTGNKETSTSTRVTLTGFTEPIDEFLDKLTDNIWDMTRHHFISYKQKENLNDTLKNLASDTGVLIMDFAENYAFICQNSTQGFYFNNTNATLFTATLYYKEQAAMDLKVECFCVISETSIHQAYSVNIFMEAIINDIKSRFSWITKIIYFSDGAPTQFKNKNHFGNLCYHEKDFGLKIVSYNFFATSHGKSACDGIGAVVKRIARKASKQRVQILNAKQMHDYLSTKESKIKILYVDDSAVEARGKSLAKRFSSAKTVKDTRQYHFFEPIDQKTMKVKFYSSDQESFIVNIFD
ncbi:uncharacterized protein LOC131671234 [Phymastichus coffea]|uniref:uncharacterized protein LOC131671234 n=1 Tax=Phymastichus coffea TaxID=108790 RepID=UPI00273B8CF3|nr:uncharacterized protein LOC131671234 [Phymastichus coffea]